MSRHKLYKFQCETCDSIMKIDIFATVGYGNYEQAYAEIYRSEGAACPICANRTLKEIEGKNAD